MKTFINTLRLPIVAALAFLVIAGLAHAQPSRLPDCYIVSAGIDDYLRANKLKGDVADARNTSAAFLSQKGKIFGNVYNYTLVDAQATRNAILQRMNSFAKVDNPGDFVVSSCPATAIPTSNRACGISFPTTSTRKTPPPPSSRTSICLTPPT